MVVQGGSLCENDTLIEARVDCNLQCVLRNLLKTYGPIPQLAEE